MTLATFALFLSKFHEFLVDDAPGHWQQLETGLSHIVTTRLACIRLGRSSSTC